MLEIRLLLLLLVANGAPILTRKLLGAKLNQPLDGGIKAPDGRRLLGPSKTIRGLVSGILASTLLAPLMGFSWLFGCWFGLLAMLGDLATSFIKRRFGLPSSSRANGLDQIPESLFPLLFCIVSLDLEWKSLAGMVLTFWLLGVLLSRLLYRMGIRRHPY